MSMASHSFAAQARRPSGSSRARRSQQPRLSSRCMPNERGPGAGAARRRGMASFGQRVEPEGLFVEPFDADLTGEAVQHDDDDVWQVAGLVVVATDVDDDQTVGWVLRSGTWR